MRLVVAVLTLALHAPLAAMELERGAVLDPLRGVLYLSAPDGRLEARDVTSGVVLWSTTAAARPLAVHSGRLLAHVADGDESLRLALFDGANGARLHEHVRGLPSGARAPLDDSLEETFELRVQADGAQVRLEWRFERRVARGVLDDDGDPQADSAHDEGARQAGALLVDLAAATFTVTDPQAPQARGALPPALAREADTGVFRERPLRAGRYYVASQQQPDGETVLRRFAGDGSPAAPLAVPRGARPQLASADGAHLLVSAAKPGAQPDEAHAWTLIGLDTGLVAATLTAPTAAAPFAVANGRALVVLAAWGFARDARWIEQPRRVEARGTPGGALVWQAALHDFTYRGPVAP